MRHACRYSFCGGRRNRIYILGLVLVSRDYETFDRFAGDKSIHNLPDVRKRNVSVKKVIGFD